MASATLPFLFLSDLALKSIFQRIEQEEQGIRENVALRTTDLMRKVFAKQDRGSQGGNPLNQF